MTHIHDQYLPKGTHIGVYEIKDTVNITSLDITYSAWNHHLKESVEILEYFPEKLTQRSNDGQRVECKLPLNKENFEIGLKAFLEKGNALTQIDHPNIAATENILEHNGTAYLITRRYDGKQLSRLIGPSAIFEEIEIKFILVSILNALKKLHECNFFHGAIQPESIFLSKDGEPILMAFSAVRQIVARQLGEVTSEMITVYMPLEQYELAAEAGSATDFYSLGATLYQCITHNEPISAQNRLNRISNGEPDPLNQLAGFPGLSLSPTVAKTINWMLKLKYSDRPQSAAELLTFIDSEAAKDETHSNMGKIEAKESMTESSVSRRGLVIGVCIAAFIVGGLWFGENHLDLVDEKIEVVTSKVNNSATTVEQYPKDYADSQSDKISSENVISSPNNSSKNEEIIAVTPTIDSEVTINQQPVIPNLENLSQVPARMENLDDKSAIKIHLNAAEKAMRASRFTTPAKDNAFKHYRMVLAIDPTNDIAQAGLRSIVDRYIQFIAKAKIEGRLADAELYLERAGNVLPNDVRLEKIKLELQSSVQ